ncbi:MAG TPA: hypothetical protein VGF67_18185 [Ktedonobacteraceae bacterium]
MRIPWAQRPPALYDRYDLLLTFDYEPFATPLPETARWLKERLQSLGLDTDPQKTLHIVAHSSGGLLARWLLEKEGGNALVQHLVLLDTPNHGSPWAESTSLFVALIGAGLNTSSVWAPGTLATLVRLYEQTGTTR